MKGQVLIMLIRRGDIFYADFGTGIGAIQGGIRPVLIMQNDTGNKYSTTVQGAPITSRLKRYQPTHYDISKYDCSVTGLFKPSIVLMEQSTTFPKSILIEKIGHINIDLDEELQDSFSVSWGFLPIAEFYRRREQRQCVCIA